MSKVKTVEVERVGSRMAEVEKVLWGVDIFFVLGGGVGGDHG